MDILVLSNCPLIESQGSGYVILNTSKCMQSLGHKVKLIGPESLSLLKFLNSRARIYRMILGMALWVLTHKIKKYDLIVFYGAESFLAVYLIKKVLRISTPIMLHSNGIEVLARELPSFTTKKWYNFNLDKFYIYCYNKVDGLLSVSKEQYDYSINVLKLDKNKAFYINLGLPEIYFENQNKFKKKKIITYCGGWLKRKGVFAMVEALEVILKKFPQYKFRLIGVGIDFKIEEYFSEQILDSIELIPYVSDKLELMNLYKESEIFLFPSNAESFGLVVAEAMYCKCATITGPMGFAAELKNMDEAIIIDGVSSHKIIKALEELINDDRLIEKLSENGHLKASKLTWGNFKYKLEIIINLIT